MKRLQRTVLVTFNPQLGALRHFQASTVLLFRHYSELTSTHKSATGPLVSSWSRAPKHQVSAHLSQEGNVLQERLDTRELDPLQVLKSELSSESLSLETAEICLLTHHRTLRHDDLTKRLANIKQHRVGGPLLKWFWADDERWLRVLYEQPVLFDRLCYLLVAEGLEDFVLQWIRSDLSHSTMKRVFGRYKNAWRGTLLRSIVEAKLQLGRSNRSADDAIEFYFRILQERDGSAADSPLRRIGMTATETTLTKHLSADRGGQLSQYDRTDDRLFDKLCDAMGSLTDRRRARYSYAKLRLAHPTTADAGPAYELLQEFDTVADPEGTQAAIPSSFESKLDFSDFMKRTASTLHAQQRFTACQWTLDLRSKLLPGMRIYRQASDHTTAAQAEATAMAREYDERKAAQSRSGRKMP